MMVCTTEIILASALGFVTFLSLALTCLFFQKKRVLRLHRHQRFLSIEKAFPDSPINETPPTPQEPFSFLGEDSVTEQILYEYQMGLDSFPPPSLEPVHQRNPQKPTISPKPSYVDSKSAYHSPKISRHRSSSSSSDLVYPVPPFFCQACQCPSSGLSPTFTDANIPPRQSIYSQNTSSMYSVASAAWYVHEEVLNKHFNEAIRRPLPYVTHLPTSSSYRIDTFRPSKPPTPGHTPDSRPPPLLQERSSVKRDTIWRRSGDGLKLVAKRKSLRAVNQGHSGGKPSVESTDANTDRLSSTLVDPTNTQSWTLSIPSFFSDSQPASF